MLLKLSSALGLCFHSEGVIQKHRHRHHVVPKNSQTNGSTRVNLKTNSIWYGSKHSLTKLVNITNFVWHLVPIFEP